MNMKSSRMGEVENEENYEEVDEVENDVYATRGSHLSRTTPSQGGALGPQKGWNLGSKSLPYPSRIDEESEGEVEDEEEEEEKGGKEHRGKGGMTSSLKEISIKNEVENRGKEVEEEEDDFDCSYSRDFEQSR